MNEINKKLNISIEIEKGQASLRQAKILRESKEFVVYIEAFLKKEGCI